MMIKLYSDNELKQLRDNDILIMYRRRPFNSIETRFIKEKRFSLYFREKNEDEFIGIYYCSFIEWGYDEEKIREQFIKYIDWSGFDNVDDWINYATKTDNKRRSPKHGAFYKIELTYSNIKSNRFKYERNDDYRGR